MISLRTTLQKPRLAYAVCFLAGALIAVSAMQFMAQKSFSAKPLAAESGPARKVSSPWGSLEALCIPFAASENIFADKPARMQAPHWFFEGFSEAQLAALIQSCNLIPDLNRSLLERTRWQVFSNGCLVLPTTAAVKGLTPESRRKLYEPLARNSANYAQQFPFRFSIGGLTEHFQIQGVKATTIELIRSLAYTNCGTLCFADLELFPDLLSPAEMEEAVDALYRIPAYRLRLRVFPDSDINALVAYWGKGLRDKKIRPLLESVAHIERPNGVSITIGSVLPDFARVRLNTFPYAWPEFETNREDCFWTSMNFFNSQPDMRYLDPSFVRTALTTDYTLIAGEPIFGDILVLANAAGDALHACVFLAEDYVYTKNGINMLSPWVIMKRSDLSLVFPSDPPLRLAYFRRKASAALPQ